MGELAVEHYRHEQARLTVDAIFSFMRLPSLVIMQEVSVARSSFLGLPSAHRSSKGTSGIRYSLRDTSKLESSMSSSAAFETLIKGLYFRHVLNLKYTEKGEVSDPVRWEVPAACAFALSEIIIRNDQEMKQWSPLPSLAAPACSSMVAPDMEQAKRYDFASFTNWLLNGDEGSKFNGLIGLLEYGLPASTSSHDVPSPMAQLASWASEIISGSVKAADWVKNGQELLVRLVTSEIHRINGQFNVSFVELCLCICSESRA